MSVSNEELRLFILHTPLTSVDAFKILNSHVEEYKQNKRNSEDVIVPLFNRSLNVAGHKITNNDDAPAQLQFTILNGEPVRLETFEALLKARPLNIGEIKNFYTNYGERYLKLYAPQSPLLESMFVEVIDNNDPGKLDILKIWLGSAPVSLAKRVQLIKRTCTAIPDYIWLVTGYGLLFLRSGQPELEALCLDYFQVVASSPEGPKYKKHWLFTFYDADLRDDIKEQLILRAQLTGRDRYEFIKKYSCKMLPFFYQSPVALQVYADAVRDGFAPRG